MGVVFVLLLGEIDLSIGYVSGVGGVIAAVLLSRTATSWSTGLARSSRRSGRPGDRLHPGVIIAKIGIPSFVVTLAGLLAWNGVVLK